MPYKIMLICLIISSYVFIENSYAKDQTRAWVHLSTATDFQHKSSLQTFAGFWDEQRWIVGDFNGDGKDDLVNVYKGQDKATVWVHLSIGSGFEYKSSFQRLAGFSDKQRWIAGDFNGDGKDDLVNVYKGQDKATVWVHLSTGSGFEYKSSFQRLAGFSDKQRWIAGDFNGDGKDDLVNVYKGQDKATVWVHLSTGSGFEYKSSFQRLAGFWDAQRWIAGDFNGDGNDDLVNVYKGQDKATVWVHLSTGSGFEYKSSFQRLAGFWDAQRWIAGDFNGDGKDDLVNVYKGQDKATAWVHLSTGSGFEYKSSFQRFAGFWDAQRWLTGDFNDDGMDDLINIYGRSEPSLPTLLSTKSAIVIEEKSGKVLGVKDPDKKRQIASTTKIMTALLIIEAINKGDLNLNTITTVSQNAGTMGDIGQNPRHAGSIMGDFGTSRNGRVCDRNNTGQDCSVGLSPGDRLSVQDLLYGLLLDSGNDAAIALAEIVAGSEAEFVDLMNQRASQIGINNTHYSNPHGRDPRRIDPDCNDVVFDNSKCAHYSSARNLADLTKFALAQPLFRMIVGTPSYLTTTWSAQTRNPLMVDLSPDNSNRLIRSNLPGNTFFYSEAFGVKTGTTSLAGACLVSAAAATNGQSVIAVVLGANNNQNDRYQDSITLLDFGLGR